MIVCFRADASVDIGHGHVTRCLTLADTLRQSGAHVVFVSRELEGNLFERIRREEHQLLPLPAEPQSELEDAAQTRTVLEAAGLHADWLIVDNYRLGAVWETALRSSANRVMVIDDLADREHECDILLDQNIVAMGDVRYSDKVPAGSTLLLGPEYALLQPVYRELHSRVNPRRGMAHRVIISWGGTDRDGLTRRSIEAVRASGRDDVEIDVVITSSHRHGGEVDALAQQDPHVRIHRDLPTLAHLLVEADLAIGAVGTTTWERLCLGVPTVAVSLADNQREIAEELGRRGLIEYLGHHDQLTDAKLVAAIEKILTVDLHDWSERCHRTVDGKGAQRVATTLWSASVELAARAANADDEALILEWANDPLTRLNAFHPDRITPEDHHVWFHKRLADPECRFFIMELPDGKAVGQVRFDRIADGWRISYAVAPDARGRGLGRSVLTTALRMMAREEKNDVVMGEVKEFNRASCRVFESLGFEQHARDGFLEYRSALPRFAR